MEQDSLARKLVINMGLKLLWTGVAINLGLEKLFGLPGLGLVGAIFLLIGIVLLWLDK